MLKIILLGILQYNYSIRCQTPKFEAKVVNGELSAITDFSYSAFLNVACNENAWTCGSSILNQYIILTAAHCLVDAISSCILVKTGHANSEEGTESLVSRFRMHRGFVEGKTAFDLALIKLKEPLVFGAHVGRVALMRYPPYDEMGVIAGWGFLDEIRLIKSILLQHTTQKITKRIPCQNFVGVLPIGVICGGTLNQKSYAAGGDSGSALVVKGYIQVGLVSYKIEEISRSLVIYTDVGYFFNWITANALWLFCDIENTYE